MNSTQEWYRQLNKPDWAPAEEVFGQVWSVLYAIIAGVNIYVFILFRQKKISWKVALPFWLNLFFNLIYSPIQFGLRNNLLATIDIVLVLATLIWAMAAIWPHSRRSYALYVPYLVWVAIATVLQVSILLSN